MSRAPASRPAAVGFARPEMIATTEWLAEHLGRPELRILDVRWRPDGTARQVFVTGHIPAAAHLDWAMDLVDREDDGQAFLLAGPEQVAGALGRAGIGDGTTLVIYDDTLSLYASRVWWSLRAYGFESARILDGGFPAWLEEGRPVSHADVAPPPAVFTPRAQLRMRLTTADVRALLGSPEVLLLDARAPAEYRGQEGNGRRLGHLPGAGNVPAAAMNRPGSQRLRTADELRDLLHRANVTRGRRIVCYDGGGVAAAKLAYVLTLLGHEDVAVYDGGWTEWGDRLDLPVER
jgi:thiosulfate/3-mercaptopyruvate sulfurtransferase